MASAQLRTADDVGRRLRRRLPRAAARLGVARSTGYRTITGVVWRSRPGANSYERPSRPDTRQPERAGQAIRDGTERQSPGDRVRFHTEEVASARGRTGLPQRP